MTVPARTTDDENTVPLYCSATRPKRHVSPRCRHESERRVNHRLAAVLKIAQGTQELGLTRSHPATGSTTRA